MKRELAVVAALAAGVAATVATSPPPQGGAQGAADARFVLVAGDVRAAPLHIRAHLQQGAELLARGGAAVRVEACASVPTEVAARGAHARLGAQVPGGRLDLDLVFDESDAAPDAGASVTRCSSILLDTLRDCDEGDCRATEPLALSRLDALDDVTMMIDLAAFMATRVPDPEDYERGTVDLAFEGGCTPVAECTADAGVE